jgi:hypothetical protein
VCKDGSAPQDGRCIGCDEIQGNSKGLIFAAVAVLLVVLAYFSYNHVPRFNLFVKKLQTRSMLVKFKQMAAFFQIVLLLPTVYIVPYPTDYIAFLSIFSFVNINLIQIFSLGCISGWTFHVSFLFACALPVCVYAFLAIMTLSYSLIKGHDAHQRKRAQQQAFGMFLLFLW